MVLCLANIHRIYEDVIRICRVAEFFYFSQNYQMFHIRPVSFFERSIVPVYYFRLFYKQKPFSTFSDVEAR